MVVSIGCHFNGGGDGGKGVSGEVEMILGMETLRTEPGLRDLLQTYAERRKASPQVEWHDRVMALDGVEEERLTKLHGLLLAGGWVETRVHGESFQSPGRLEACYRITPEGLAALRMQRAVGHESDDEPPLEIDAPQA